MTFDDDGKGFVGTDTNGQSKPKKSADLGDLGKRFRRAMNDSATGPLQIAHQVCDVVANWESAGYRELTDESAAVWIRNHTGQQPHFFQQRADAIDALGRDVSRWMHHETANYLARRGVSEVQLREVKVALVRKYNESDQCVQSHASNLRIIEEVLGLHRKNIGGAVWKNRALELLAWAEKQDPSAAAEFRERWK